MRRIKWALYLSAFALAAERRGTIEPSIVTLAAGASQQFQVKGADVKEWSVNDVAGGSRELGSIDARGLYRAPRRPPSPHEVRIRATLRGAANRYLWATVKIEPPGQAYKLLRTWGQAGDGPDRFTMPHGICLDRDGNVIVVDSQASRVARFTPEGKFLGAIGAGPGEDSGQFRAPRDAKVDSAGRVWVSDANNYRFQVFSPEGALVRMFGRKGSGPGELLRAHSIDFGSGERLYVADVDNSRIAVYDSHGRPLFAWGKDGRAPGEFHAPHGIGTDANGDVFVSNYYGPCQKFTAQGEFLFQFAPAQPPDGPIHFHSMATDRWGNVYLAARDGKRRSSIRKYNNNGDFVTAWSLSAPDHFVEGVAIDPKGLVYAAFKGETDAGVEVFAPQ